MPSQEREIKIPQNNILAAMSFCAATTLAFVLFDGNNKLLLVSIRVYVLGLCERAVEPK